MGDVLKGVHNWKQNNGIGGGSGGRGGGVTPIVDVGSQGLSQAQAQVAQAPSISAPNVGQAAIQLPLTNSLFDSSGGGSVGDAVRAVAAGNNPYTKADDPYKPQMEDPNLNKTNEVLKKVLDDILYRYRGPR